MYDSGGFLIEYLMSGLYHFNGSGFLKTIDLSKFETVKVKHEDNCFHAEGHEFHNDYMVDTISKLRLGLMSLLHEWEPTIKFDFYSDTVNEQTQIWHNDADYGLPNQNATINCFFDRTALDIGGNFNIGPYDPELMGKNVESGGAICYFPKEFDILIFNQNRNFIHKATPSTKPRRMISFAVAFADLNPLLSKWY